MGINRIRKVVTAFKMCKSSMPNPVTQGVSTKRTITEKIFRMKMTPINASPMIYEPSYQREQNSLSYKTNTPILIAVHKIRKYSSTNSSECKSKHTKSCSQKSPVRTLSVSKAMKYHFRDIILTYARPKPNISISTGLIMAIGRASQRRISGS